MRESSYAAETSDLLDRDSFDGQNARHRFMVPELVHGNGGGGASQGPAGQVWGTERHRVFAIWYLELDAGGQPGGFDDSGAPRDFAFPQMTIPSREAGMQPRFVESSTSRHGTHPRSARLERCRSRRRRSCSCCAVVDIDRDVDLGPRRAVNMSDDAARNTGVTMRLGRR